MGGRQGKARALLGEGWGREVRGEEGNQGERRAARVGRGHHPECQKEGREGQAEGAH